MTVFVDTSALLALLDPDDRRHAEAKAAFRKAHDEEESLITSNYVVLELFSIVQRRFWVRALSTAVSVLLAVIDVRWVDAEIHEAGVASLFAAGRRKLGLVDFTSFAIMQREGITHAFAYDRHFQDRGFQRYA